MKTYPIEFEHGRMVKVVAPGKSGSDTPIEITIDIDAMEPGTSHRIDINADGSIAIHSKDPFIEIPPDLPEGEEDAYVAAMTEKQEAIQAEFLEELRDTQAQSNE